MQQESLADNSLAPKSQKKRFIIKLAEKQTTLCTWAGIPARRAAKICQKCLR